MGLELNQIVTKADLLPLLERMEKLERENERLKRGLSAYVRTAEAQTLTGLHPDTLRALCRQGVIEHKKEGSLILYLRASLEQLNEEATIRPRRNRKTSTI